MCAWQLLTQQHETFPPLLPPPLDRFPTKNRPAAKNLTTLHGISCLSSTHGLRSIRDVTDLDAAVRLRDDGRLSENFGTKSNAIDIRQGENLTHLTPSQRREAGIKPVKKYWNGQASQARTRPLPEASRKPRANVTYQYPFADEKSNVENLLRMGLKSEVKTKSTMQKKKREIMNSLGVSPLSGLSERQQRRVIEESFNEFNFSSRGGEQRELYEAYSAHVEIVRTVILIYNTNEN